MVLCEICGAEALQILFGSFTVRRIFVSESFHLKYLLKTECEANEQTKPCSEAQNSIPSSGMVRQLKGRGCVHLERFHPHQTEKDSVRRGCKGLTSSCCDFKLCIGKVCLSFDELEILPGKSCSPLPCGCGALGSMSRSAFCSVWTRCMQLQPWSFLCSEHSFATDAKS